MVIDKIVDNTIDGKCSHCGNCCSGVPLPFTKNEAFEI